MTSRPPPGEDNPAPYLVSDLIPFSFQEQIWDDAFDAYLNGTVDPADDNYSWNGLGPENIVEGVGDGIPEIHIYPTKTGSPGNWGTVNIGPDNNPTNRLADQIAYGVTQEHFDAIGGSLTLDQTDGSGRPYKNLNGDTGISSGMQNAIEGRAKYSHTNGIIGYPRTMLLHEGIPSGPGNNATFKIVRFEKVVLVHYDQRGANTEMIVQPVLPGNSGGGNDSGGFVGDGGVFSPDVPPSDTLFLLALTR